MDQKMTAHNPEECKSIFVEWKWLIGIIVGAITVVGGVAGSLAWAGSREVTSNEMQHKDYNKYDIRILELENTAKSVVNKLDTLIVLAKNKK